MELLNTLYVTTPRSYLRLDHDTIRVDVGGETALRLPLLHLESIVCFGDVSVSTPLILRCGQEGRSIVFLDFGGRFRARVVGPTGGNVLLRLDQHRAAGDAETSEQIARGIVAGKVQNSRQILLRGAREAGSAIARDRLHEAAKELAAGLQELRLAAGMDAIRGEEGNAARWYFSVFGEMVRAGDFFAFPRRSRRPPADPVNAALSFAYSLLVGECVAALECVGLDPQIGYLHAVRPGRPALALDLMEELRPALADRLVLALINRRQLGPRDFDRQLGGAVLLTDGGRRTFLTAWQKRKVDTVRHQVLERNVPVGLLPHLQARLLARRLRGDAEFYLPFVLR